MNEIKSNKAIAILVGCIIFVLAVAIMYLLRSIFIPFVIAIILSFIGQPIVRFFKKLKFPNFLAILTYVLILVVVSVIVVGFFTSNITQFVKNSEKYKKDYVTLIDKYSGSLESQMTNFKHFLRIPEETSFTPFEWVEQALNSIEEAAELDQLSSNAKPLISQKAGASGEASIVDSLPVLNVPLNEELLAKGAKKKLSVLQQIDWVALLKPLLSFSGSVVNFLGKLMLIMIFLMFIMAENSSFKNKLLIFFPGKKEDQIRIIFENINKQVVIYLNVKVLISLITGILVFLSASTIGLDYAFMWGVIAFVMNFIPSIGSILFFFMPSFMAVVQFLPQERWGSMLAVFISIGLIEFIVGNLIDPKLSGDKLDLSPLVIIISLLFWGWLWGIAGMFLAVPMMLVIKLICENIPSMHPLALMLSSGKSSASNGKMKLYLRVEGWLHSVSEIIKRKYNSPASYFKKKRGESVKVDKPVKQNQNKK